jgi:hypothetical protein
MKTTVSVLVSAVMLASGCALSLGGGKVRWSGEILARGFVLTIDDPLRVETLQFSNGGYVGATLGTKNLVTFPLLQWRLDGDWLVIFDEKHAKIEELKLTTIRAHSLTAVRRSGEVVKFKISKA